VGQLLTMPWTTTAPRGPGVVQIPPAVAVLVGLLLLGGIASMRGCLRAAHVVARHRAATSDAD
jgi:hypothetical protein